MACCLNNRRGQQIGDYAVLVGVVASACIGSQMMISRRVAGGLWDAREQILGSVAPLEARVDVQADDENPAGTYSTNHSSSWVQEQATRHLFRTRAGSTNTGRMHSGFVLAEAPGPYLGVRVPLDRSTAGPGWIGLQLCGRGCEDLVLAEDPTVTKDKDGFINVTLMGVDGSTRTLRYKVLNRHRDGRGLWHATLLRGNGKRVKFVGVTQDELYRADGMVAQVLTELHQEGVPIEDQWSDRLASIWQWMKQGNRNFDDAEGYREPNALWEMSYGPLLTSLSKLVGGEEDGELELNDETLSDLLDGLEQLVSRFDNCGSQDPLRVYLRDAEGGPHLSDAEIDAWLQQQSETAATMLAIVSIVTDELDHGLGGGFHPATFKLRDMPQLLRNLSQRDPKRFANLKARLEEPSYRLEAIQTDARADTLAGVINWNPRLAGYGRDWRDVSEFEFNADDADQSMAKAAGALDDAQRERWGIQRFLAGHWKDRQARAEELHGEGLSDRDVERELAAEGFLSLEETLEIQEHLSAFDRIINAGASDSDNGETLSFPPAPRQLRPPVGVEDGEDIRAGDLPYSDRKAEVVGKDGKLHTVPRIMVEAYESSKGDDGKKAFETIQDRLAAARPSLDGAVEQLVKEYVCGFGCNVRLDDGDLAGPGVRVYTLPGSAKEYEEAVSNAIVSDRLQERLPLTGPRGKPADVLIGGENDMLNDLVGTEQVVWVMVGEDGPLSAMTDNPGRARPATATLPDPDEVIPSPLYLQATGLVGPPPDRNVPEDLPESVQRLPGVTYPGEDVFVPYSEGLTMQDAVDQGLVGTGGSGGRTDPRFNQDWIKSIQQPGNPP